MWQYIIIFLVLVLISLVVVKLNKKNFTYEINKLVQYLGGKDNILDTEVEMSRFKVTLKDITKATNDPFSEYFNIYTNSTSGMKVRISTGTALILSGNSPYFLLQDGQ